MVDWLSLQLFLTYYTSLQLTTTNKRPPKQSIFQQMQQCLSEKYYLLKIVRNRNSMFLRIQRYAILHTFELQHLQTILVNIPISQVAHFEMAIWCIHDSDKLFAVSDCKPTIHSCINHKEPSIITCTIIIVTLFNRNVVLYNNITNYII